MSQNSTEFGALADDREADDRLVHALLLHIHNPQAADQRQQRIDRVMQSIDPGATPPNISMRPLRVVARAKRAALAIAAILLIVFGIFSFTMSSHPVYASLGDVLSALNRPGDRTYRIHVEPSDAELQSRHGLDGAKLDLREGGQYVLTRYTPDGEELLDGFDGHQSWRIRRGQLVETKNGLGAGGIPMPSGMADVSFVDLAQTLSHLQGDYTIERFDQATLTEGGTSFCHLLAQRTSPRVKGPQTIEIWANSKTGMPQKIVFDKAKFQGNPEPRRLTFELDAEVALPENWFASAGHVPATPAFPGINSTNQHSP